MSCSEPEHLHGADEQHRVCGSVVLQYGINGLGTLTIAGHTAARKLFSFTSMPLISMANAGSTFVSQNRGAAQPERVRKGMRTMYLCSVVIMAAEVVLMQLFPAAGAADLRFLRASCWKTAHGI